MEIPFKFTVNGKIVVKKEIPSIILSCIFFTNMNWVLTQTPPLQIATLEKKKSHIHYLSKEVRIMSIEEQPKNQNLKRKIKNLEKQFKQ